MGIWFIFPWEILIEILRPRWDGQPLSRSAVGATGGNARTRCREGRGGFGWGGAAAKVGEARGAEAPQAAGGGRGEASSVGKALGTRRDRLGRRSGRGELGREGDEEEGRDWLGRRCSAETCSRGGARTARDTELPVSARHRRFSVANGEFGVIFRGRKRRFGAIGRQNPRSAMRDSSAGSTKPPVCDRR